MCVVRGLHGIALSLSIGDIHTFTEGMTRGAGYLAIASVIFGKWRNRRHGSRMLIVWRCHGAAIPAARAWDSRSECFAHYATLPSRLISGRGLVGRQMAPATLGEPYRR
jgi:general nucleoside transport system permease protein